MKTNITNTAIKIGISQGFLSNILTGRRRPGYKMAKKIGVATRTSPILWLEGTPDEIRHALFPEKSKAASKASY